MISPVVHQASEARHVARSPPTAPFGPAGGMALTHTDVSAFTTWTAHLVHSLGASALRSKVDAADCSSIPRVARYGAGASSDAMQVEPSSAAAVAAASAAQLPAVARPGLSTAGPSEPSEALPSASRDVSMVDAAAVPWPTRKHSDAPMRKLSVSLIDTYKLINQVRAAPSPRSRRHGGACGPLIAWGKGGGGGRRC